MLIFLKKITFQSHSDLDFAQGHQISQTFRTHQALSEQQHLNATALIALEIIPFSLLLISHSCDLDLWSRSNILA